MQRLRSLMAIMADLASICSALAIVTVSVVLVRGAPSPQTPREASRVAARAPAPASAMPLRTMTNVSSQVPPEARVAIVEFSDYYCPYCSRHASAVMPHLQREYIDKGLLAYVVRDLPVTATHPLAFRASEAAECAREQGLFWEMRHHLFDRPAAMAFEDALYEKAEKSGLQRALFDQCMDQGRSGKVDADRAEAKRLGIAQTPTFLIGTIDAKGEIIVSARVIGNQPLRVFQKLLDEELSNASRKQKTPIGID